MSRAYGNQRSLMRFPGERTLWKGQPSGGILLTPWDIFLVPFSLFWCGFAIIWEIGALSMGAPGFFALFGIPFVVIGLYLVAGRFLVDMLLRRSTRYELTDRRLIVERSGWFSKTTTLFISDLPHMTLKERSSGRGTIRFGQADFFSMWMRGWEFWSPSMDPTPQLLNIDRAAEVFDLIQRQQAEYWEARQ